MTATSREPPRPWLARTLRWLVLGLIAAAVVFMLATGKGDEWRNRLRTGWGDIDAWVRDNLVLAVVLYFLVYVLVTGLSIPIANVLSIGSGILFGLWTGLGIVSFASTAGATLAFLGSRYLFRDAVRRKLGPRFDAINQNIEREGAFYLFSLRLMIVVPFWMINLALGLTTMRVWTFWWVSQIGMLPGTFLYINAGAQVIQISEVGDIFSPGIILSFALLGVAPLLLRWLILWLRRDKLPNPT